MDDIDAMFSEMLGEMDLLTKSLDQEMAPPDAPPSTSEEVSFSIGFPDLNESLQELEDNDLDALMADLVADLNATEQKLAAEIEDLKVPPPPQPHLPPKSRGAVSTSSSSTISGASSPASSATSPLPPPPPQSAKPSMEEIEAQMKADKIKLAAREAKRS
ncbi:hypothetical protein fugu_016137 [Takifugu bimaculatus]|uniref:Uncharacterized protein n=1 Tax=Takifugu bimaculatus TaxID=433685 RepID=A0A4Z2BY38_9TELE|nr:hypothetical protein fugu_016137 [Takifugu bimaculatus]